MPPICDLHPKSPIGYAWDKIIYKMDTLPARYSIHDPDIRRVCNRAVVRGCRMNVNAFAVILATHILGVFMGVLFLITWEPWVGVFGLSLMLISDIAIVINDYWVKKCETST